MSATPSDSRYIPLTNQPSCCVPTCIQMVMYRRGIPLLPAEEIGLHLGLVVPPDQSNLFWQPSVVDGMPPAGYGIRFNLPEYEPNSAFTRMGIPLRLTVEPISEFGSAHDLLDRLCELEAADDDAILPWNIAVLLDDPSRQWAHATVFDRVVEGRIRIIDPGFKAPKWSSFEAGSMFAAMRRHIDAAGDWAGIWRLSETAARI